LIITGIYLKIESLMNKKIRVAVIGTGALGKEHVRIYSELSKEGMVQLAGVYDISCETAKKIATKYNTEIFGTLQEAIHSADAFSVVTPTTSHFEIAREILLQNKHALVEKPFTLTYSDAEVLIDIANRNNCILQVGHVERFNPVFEYILKTARNPRFIESHRLSPFPSRSTDIGVVLDLMIHDIDIVLTLVGSPIEHIDAVGVPVLSSSEDIANARITFKNGCVANLTASRISPEKMRKIRVFCGTEKPCYLSLDYKLQEGYIYRLFQDEDKELSIFKRIISSQHRSVITEFANKKIIREPVPIEKREPLKLEIQSFIECIIRKQKPLVSGESAGYALDIALNITRIIQNKIKALSRP